MQERTATRLVRPPDGPKARPRREKPHRAERRHDAPRRTIPGGSRINEYTGPERTFLSGPNSGHFYRGLTNAGNGLEPAQVDGENGVGDRNM